MKPYRITAAGAALLGTLGWTPAPAADVTLLATDSGFVTLKGGSSKGDAHFVPPGTTPGPKYNYSAGYEVHYTSGFASPPPYAAMDRKNYFVFDIGAIPEAIASATLKLWAGELESVDTFETYVLRETPDQGALFELATLATLPKPEFDGPGDMGVTLAESVYSKLAVGATVLASVDITKAMDDSVVSLSFTAAGIAHLNGLRLAGGSILLAGLVTTVDATKGTPQQPFGFTDVDIPASGPLVPALLVTTVPEPSSVLQIAAGLGLLGVASSRKWKRRPDSNSE